MTPDFKARYEASDKGKATRTAYRRTTARRLSWHRSSAAYRSSTKGILNRSAREARIALDQLRAAGALKQENPMTRKDPYELRRDDLTAEIRNSVRFLTSRIATHVINECLTRALDDFDYASQMGDPGSHNFTIKPIDTETLNEIVRLLAESYESSVENDTRTYTHAARAARAEQADAA